MEPIQMILRVQALTEQIKQAREERADLFRQLAPHCPIKRGTLLMGKGWARHKTVIRGVVDKTAYNEDGWTVHVMRITAKGDLSYRSSDWVRWNTSKQVHGLDEWEVVETLDVPFKGLPDD